MRQKAAIILIHLALLCCLPAAVAAQDADLERALRDLGLSEPELTLEADRALVVYQQPVAEMGPIEAELERVARVLALFEGQLAPEAEVSLRQRFDDGQIMQVVGTPALGNAYLDGEIDASAFEMALRFEPLTRGPLILEGVCNLAAGDNCETEPACACYPDESCQPADPAANPKGCLVGNEPANAHLEGSEYACDDGYIWNLEMTGCEPTVECPEGTQLMDGDCVAPATAEPADQGQGEVPQDDDDEDEEPLTGLLDPTWILWVCGGGCLTGLIVLVVVVILLLRRRKSRAEAVPARTPVTPAPAAPARPDPYADVERRLRTLQARYQAGAVDQAAYQAELKKLVLQDENGRYWTLAESGWHCYDGQRWVRADPPGRR